VRYFTRIEIRRDFVTPMGDNYLDAADAVGVGWMMVLWGRSSSCYGGWKDESLLSKRKAFVSMSILSSIISNLGCSKNWRGRLRRLFGKEPRFC
jgi:hypothetical protein